MRRLPRRTPRNFPQLKLVSIADFGGWQKAQEAHFTDGAIFDQITATAR